MHKVRYINITSKRQGCRSRRLIIHIGSELDLDVTDLVYGSKTADFKKLNSFSKYYSI